MARQLGGGRRIARSVGEGARMGARAAGGLIAVMAPISCAAALLQWSGALNGAAGVLGPALGWLSLPPEAALPLLVGALVNCYSGIAAMSVASLDGRETTILALMILFAHNLPVETAVQRRAGSSARSILALRLGAAATGGALLAWLLPQAGDARVGVSASPLMEGREALSGVLSRWAVDALGLSTKVLVLVVGLMILQRLLQEFGLLGRLAGSVAPLVAALGAPRRAAHQWLVAQTLGLAYGAALLLEGVRAGGLTREEVEGLNRSIALCHALIEDTLLFVAVGVAPLWIVAPRLLFAAAVGWAERFWRAGVRPS